MADEVNESQKAVDNTNNKAQSTANNKDKQNTDGNVKSNAETVFDSSDTKLEAPAKRKPDLDPELVEADNPDDEPQPTDSRWKRWRKTGHPFTIIVLAVVILIGLSFVPWGKLTGNFMKDFNLFSDVMPGNDTDSVVESNEMIDPALLAEMENGEAEMTGAVVDSLPALLTSNGEIVENPGLDTLEVRNVPTKSSRVDGKMVLEDYTYDGSGLKNLKRAIAQRGKRPARIAMIGDSYIEGDIITMDLRDQMQNVYGGRGVGYVAAHNVAQGFRTTVRHSDKGWTQQPMAKVATTKYMPLWGEYFTGNAGASLQLKGVDKDPKLQGWNQTRVLFIAPADGKITIKADSTEHIFDVKAAPGVQSVLLPGETSEINLTSEVPGVKLLGVWLEDADGVVVDNMSVRGDSGISRRFVNVSMAQQMRQYVDYDLIIVEYGINALSAAQSDYSTYGHMMLNVLQRLKQSYPNADIILMGIGDRGQKIHGEPHSLPTVPNMIAAQRQAAKTAGVLFWDTREAMGGEDAIVRWRDKKLANGDFIHLNHQGGKVLGEELFQSINAALK